MLSDSQIEDNDGHMPAGEHKFPFTFTLPPNLPSSFEVQYKLPRAVLVSNPIITDFLFHSKVPHTKIFFCKACHYVNRSHQRGSNLVHIDLRYIAMGRFWGNIKKTVKNTLFFYNSLIAGRIVLKTVLNQTLLVHKL